jgi:tRNA 2-thiouridine synthesizing protein A
MAQIQVDQTLDARGLLCPMPIVKTSKAMKELGPGQVLKLMATDRGSITDVPAWCESTGNALVDWHEEEDCIVFLVRKGEED